MKKLLRASLVLAVVAAVYAPAVAQEQPPAQITVSGTGEISVKPDLAIMNFGVQKMARTAREALDENNKAMSDVLAILKASGIEEKNIKTSGFSIYPQFDYQKNSDGASKIVGYQVRNAVTAKVTDLEALGEILDKAVDAGLNEGGQISFTNQDVITLERQAEAAAVKDAMEKASLLAQAAGAEVGKIISIQEDGASAPNPPRMARMAMEAAPSGVPVESGENTYSANVTITLAIEQK